MFVAVTCDPAYSQNDATMLEGLVGIKQFCAYAADLWANGMGKHLPQPIRRDDLDVVVDEAYDFAPGLRDTVIIDGGVVEGLVVGHYAHAGVLARNPGEILERIGIGASIVKDQDFKILVVGFLDNARNGCLDKFAAVSGGDKEAYQRLRRRDGPANAVGIGSWTQLRTGIASMH